jgi:hypothetical protein
MGRRPSLTVGHRTLVQIAAGQEHATLAQPGIHLLAGKQLLGALAAE